MALQKWNPRLFLFVYGGISGVCLGLGLECFLSRLG